MEITLTIEQLKGMTIGEIVELYEDIDAISMEEIYQKAVKEGHIKK